MPRGTPIADYAPRSIDGSPQLRNGEWPVLGGTGGRLVFPCPIPPSYLHPPRVRESARSTTMAATPLNPFSLRDSGSPPRLTSTTGIRLAGPAARMHRPQASATEFWDPTGPERGGFRYHLGCCQLVATADPFSGVELRSGPFCRVLCPWRCSWPPAVVRYSIARCETTVLGAAVRAACSALPTGLPPRPVCAFGRQRADGDGNRRGSGDSCCSWMR
jgi:hypothetical protein